MMHEAGWNRIHVGASTKELLSMLDAKPRRYFFILLDAQEERGGPDPKWMSDLSGRLPLDRVSVLLLGNSFNFLRRRKLFQTYPWVDGVIEKPFRNLKLQTAINHTTRRNLHNRSTVVLWEDENVTQSYARVLESHGTTRGWRKYVQVHSAAEFKLLISEVPPDVGLILVNNETLANYHNPHSVVPLRFFKTSHPGAILPLVCLGNPVSSPVSILRELSDLYLESNSPGAVASLLATARQYLHAGIMLQRRLAGARTGLAQGNFRLAARYLRRHLRDSPDSARVHELLAEGRWRNGNYESAVKSFQTALARNPFGPLSYLRLGDPAAKLTSAPAAEIRAMAERFCPGHPGVAKLFGLDPNARGRL